MELLTIGTLQKAIMINNKEYYSSLLNSCINNNGFNINSKLVYFIYFLDIVLSDL